MELSLLMRLRIAAAAAVGVLLIGIFAWPLASSSEPLNAVLARDISTGGLITLVVLAFLSGIIGYFVSWPYGREIGILAVPSGLSIWAVRSASMTKLIQLNPVIEQRQAIFSSFKWDSAFWLTLIAAGFAGVLLGQEIMSSPTKPVEETSSSSKATQFLSVIIGLVGSVLIAQFCIKMFAQDVSLLDHKLGSIVAQPSVGQILFAVFVSFGLAAFIVKKFLDVGYVWPVIATFLLTVFSVSSYAKPELLQYFISQWPPGFFVNSVIAILPIQLVAFGTLGSIAGYWMAIRFNYWRKHEMK